MPTFKENPEGKPSVPFGVHAQKENNRVIAIPHAVMSQSQQQQQHQAQEISTEQGGVLTPEQEEEQLQRELDAMDQQYHDVFHGLLRRIVRESKPTQDGGDEYDPIHVRVHSELVGHEEPVFRVRMEVVTAPQDANLVVEVRKRAECGTLVYAMRRADTDEVLEGMWSAAEPGAETDDVAVKNESQAE
jgi:hypothetical protein